MNAALERRRNHWGGESVEETGDENVLDNIEDNEDQQYFNGINNDDEGHLSSETSISRTENENLDEGSQNCLSYTSSIRSSFGRSLSYSKNSIPLPPAPHIPKTSRNSSTASVASNSSSTASTLGDYFESQQTSSKMEETETPLQKHHLPWHSSIIQSSTPGNTNIDEEDDTKDIYRRSIEDIASYYNDKDDSNISRLSSILESARAEKIPQDRVNMMSIYSTASSVQPIPYTLNEDDGSWYDPDTMQRMSNVSLDNDCISLNSLSNQSKATGMTINDRAQQYISQIYNKRNDPFPCHTRIIPKVLYLVMAVTFIMALTGFTYSELVALKSYSGSSSDGSKVPVAQSDLMYICDSNQNNFPSERWEVKECETLCLAASCCVAPDHKLNYCFEDNIDACLSYQPCAVIQPVFGMLTQEAADVVSAGVKSEYRTDDTGVSSPNESSSNHEINIMTEVCKPESYGTQEGKAQCEEYCVPSECCFSESGCWKSQPEDALKSAGFYGSRLCSLYSSCLVVYFNEDQGEHKNFAADSEIFDIASISQPPSPLKKHLNDNNTDKKMESVNVTAPSNNNNVTTVQSLKNSVDLACSPNTTFDEHNHILINNNATTVQCEDLCHPAQCCYHPDIESNCWDDLSVMCDTFSSCGILGADLFIYPPSSTNGDTLAESHNGSSEANNDLDLRSDLLSTVDSMLQMLCGDEEQLQMEDSLQQLCEEMCLPYSCCFVNGSSAGGGSDYSECEDFNTASLCPSYIACSVVYWSANNSVLGGVFLGSVTVKSSNDGNQ